MLPDLLGELRDAWPELSDRWVVYGAPLTDRPPPLGQRRRTSRRPRAAGAARRASRPTRGCTPAGRRSPRGGSTGG